MFTLHYLNVGKASTFTSRHMLRDLGLKWDTAKHAWYSKDGEGPVHRAVQSLGFGYVTEEHVTDLPKAKPRGRSFHRGLDPRRERQPDNGSADNVELLEDNVEPLPVPERVKPLLKASSDNGDAAAALAAAVQAIAGQSLNAEAVRAIVREETAHSMSVDEIRKAVQDAVNALPPREIVVKMEACEARQVKIEGTAHKALPNVLHRISAGLQNILLVGPAGTGKTTLGLQVAEALGLSFASVSCSAGMSEGVLLGRLLPTGEGGRFEYSEAPFIHQYENGGVFVLDEVDAADANVLLVLNSALANGHLDVPNRLQSPTARRHKDFILIAVANTYGTGADRMYVGRNQLDAAFLSRFAGCVVDVGYDKDLERTLAANILGEQAQSWLGQVWTMREQLESLKIRRVWGTREMLHGAKFVKQGDSHTSALQALVVGWTKDEIQKVGL